MVVVKREESRKVNNSLFYEKLLETLCIHDAYNKCLITNTSKNNGYFLCMDNHYDVLMIDDEISLNNFLKKEFINHTENYIHSNRDVLQDANSYLFIMMGTDFINYDVCRYFLSLDIAKKTYNTCKGHFYAIVDHRGNQIKIEEPLK